MSMFSNFRGSCFPILPRRRWRASGTGPDTRFARLLGLSALIYAVVSLSSAQAAEDLTRLSLEELMNVEIKSVAKKPQRVSDSAAAVHVITKDDIRRSTATLIPELLRNVPGLNVARIDSNK